MAESIKKDIVLEDVIITEEPTIKPFLQNTLNQNELVKNKDRFIYGWTSRYNTVQVAVSKDNYQHQ